jgi:hypothetical protein
MLANTIGERKVNMSMTTPLNQLHPLGQSIWMDCIGRDLITSGKLRRLIDDDGLRWKQSPQSAAERADRARAVGAGFLMSPRAVA